ncbi:hypothetical protein [Cupriavidus pinatubonensis]|uniref:Uncharacterized protein n=1 Tax=Cupriavidus pinatubonensis TaxID=248026 RepID=A0ABN7ZH51_9BURK|nr:hypothetical protein [Cupriavidus pinatubonensis]CAG9183616.1 hypothetical protein LMG23994_05189 [Cupriavidus pinatubonensis]
MSDGLLSCAHCDSQPRFIANRCEAVIVCTGCGISTPPQALDAGRDQAFAILSGIWNTRVRPRPTEQHELAVIVRKELTSSDLGTVLALIARNEDDWDTRGPLFAAMAEQLLQPEPILQELVPAEALLKDASRYRKLMRRAKLIQIDGRPWVHIEPIDALPGSVHEELFGGTIILEEFLARVLDCTDVNGTPISATLGKPPSA